MAKSDGTPQGLNSGLQYAIKQMDACKESLRIATERLAKHNVLVDRAQKGDSEAIEELRLRFERRVYRTAAE